MCLRAFVWWPVLFFLFTFLSMIEKNKTPMAPEPPSELKSEHDIVSTSTHASSTASADTNCQEHSGSGASSSRGSSALSRWTPVAIRSGTLGAATSLPDIKSALHSGRPFKFVPNIRPSVVARTPKSLVNSSEALGPSKLDIGAVLAHSLSLNRQSSQSLQSVHFRCATGPAKGYGGNRDTSLSTSMRTLQAQRLASRKSAAKKKSLSMSELSWIEGPSGAPCYAPITLSFIATEEQDMEDQTPSRKSKRPTIKHIDESNRSAAAVFQHDDTLMEDEETDAQWLFVQLPAVFPALNKFATTAPREGATQKSAALAGSARQGESSAYCACRFDGLPEGHLGTLNIHKSGRVVLHVGDHHFNVNQGSECSFSEEVACLLSGNAELMFLGPCNKRIVVTPDVQKYMEKSGHQ